METVSATSEENLPRAIEKTSITKEATKTKSNKRRRKRSYRKNSRIGKKFNAKNRDSLLQSQRQQRRQLFWNTEAFAPYNTNEFLMADHGQVSPNFNIDRSINATNSHESESMSGSALDEDEFLTREFRHDYENLRLEQLQGMPKEKVIEEYLKLESSLEKEFNKSSKEIQTLNNKIKELNRRLKHRPVDADQYSDDSGSSSSSSSGSSSTSSSKEEKPREMSLPDEIPIEPPAQMTEKVVSC